MFVTPFSVVAPEGLVCEVTVASLMGLPLSSKMRSCKAPALIRLILTVTCVTATVEMYPVLVAFAVMLQTVCFVTLGALNIAV